MRGATTAGNARCASTGCRSGIGNQHAPKRSPAFVVRSDIDACSTGPNAAAAAQRIAASDCTYEPNADEHGVGEPGNDGDSDRQAG